MQRGIAFGLSAYIWWGFTPVYWKQLNHIPSLDVTCFRMIWTFVLLSAVHLARHSWQEIKDLLKDRRQRYLQITAAGLLSTNWLVFVWAIGNGQVVEASLGYFMNPLINVLLGYLFLGEKFRSSQKMSIGLALAGVLVLTIAVGSIPIVALYLATSFGFYGLVKSKVDRPALNTLTVEVMFMSVPALIYLILRGIDGYGAMGLTVHADNLWLISTGIATSVPLLFFAVAVQRVPLGVLGMMQYVAPTTQLILGVAVYDEVIARGELVGYSIIWAAVALFAVDGLVALRNNSAKNLSNVDK
ncbi:MAG TPA: EamA family transporter RarD [Acidimicrobiales bacterium]|nr:EamA family transporter RarD [Acidimicrobiales bacterium]